MALHPNAKQWLPYNIWYYIINNQINKYAHAHDTFYEICTNV